MTSLRPFPDSNHPLKDLNRPEPASNRPMSKEVPEKIRNLIDSSSKHPIQSPYKNLVDN
jgi:hypothetical protein